MLQSKLGIIGCGNMGEAILKGVITRKILDKKNIYIIDSRKARSAALRKKYGINVQSSTSGLIKKADVILLAVKPQSCETVLNEIRYFVDRKKLVISIMAGIKTENIKKKVGKAIPIVRVMPNIAAFIGESISAVSYNNCATKKHQKITQALFGGIGKIIEISEKKQDAFTAIAGSGPAYFFYILEVFAEIARKYGFSHKEAMQLITQTIKGSAKILNAVHEKPDILRKKVTSKGGTTEAALKIFKKKNLGKIFEEAVRVAVKRSKELSK